MFREKVESLDYDARPNPTHDEKKACCQAVISIDAAPCPLPHGLLLAQVPFSDMLKGIEDGQWDMAL